MLVLSSTKPENIEEDEDLMNAAAELIERKNRGGLVYPTRFMLQVVMVLERSFRVLFNEDNLGIRGAGYLRCVIKNILGQPPVFFDDHALETQHGIDNHYSNLLNIITDLFYTVRVNQRSRKINLKLHKTMIRHKTTKLVIFTGQ